MLGMFNGKRDLEFLPAEAIWDVLIFQEVSPDFSPGPHTMVGGSSAVDTVHLSVVVHRRHAPAIQSWSDEMFHWVVLSDGEHSTVFCSVYFPYTRRPGYSRDISTALQRLRSILSEFQKLSVGVVCAGDFNLSQWAASVSGAPRHGSAARLLEEADTIERLQELSEEFNMSVAELDGGVVPTRVAYAGRGTKESCLDYFWISRSLSPRVVSVSVQPDWQARTDHWAVLLALRSPVPVPG